MAFVILSSWQTLQLGFDTFRRCWLIRECLFVCLFFCFRKERRAVIIINNNNNRRYSIQSPYWSQTWSNGFSVEKVAPAWLVCGLTSSLKYCMERRGGRSSPSSSLPPLPHQTGNASTDAGGRPPPHPTALSSPTKFAQKEIKRKNTTFHNKMQ